MRGGGLQPDPHEHHSVTCEREWDILSALIGRIYDCALDPTLWNDTLAHLIAALSPADWDVAALMWERTSPPGGRFVGAAGVSAMAREVYSASFAGRNPWTRRIATLPLGRVVDTDEIMPRSELVESALYKDFLSTWRMDLAIAVTLDRRGNERLGLVMPGPSNRDLTTLKRGLRLLAPHFQRAIRISRSLGEANLRAEAAEAVLDRSPFPVLTLGAGLEIVNANKAALALADDAVIEIEAGKFRFRDRDAQSALARLAASTEAGSAAFNIETAGGAKIAVLAARMTPQMAMTIGGEIGGANLVLSFGIGSGAPLMEIDRLAGWFGLSPAEGRLTAALAAGCDLRGYARQRNVSMNAVRFLLKGVYRKTGARSQAQLVARVRDLPAH